MPDARALAIWPRRSIHDRRAYQSAVCRRPPGRSGRGPTRTRGTDAASGTTPVARPSGDAGSTRSSRPRARTSASPIPPMTSAIPSPKATTSTNPNAGRPAAIEPSRISSALVDGIRPPARPSTNRLRHEIVVPAGGRWLWATPPWLCAAMRGRRGVMVVVVVVVVRRCARGPRRDRGRAGAPPLRRAPANGAAPRRTASSRRSHDRDRGHDQGADRTTTSGGRTPWAPTTSAASTRIPSVCDSVTDKPEPGGVERRSPGPDQVGRHQGLAVAGRQGMARTERGGRQERHEQHDRRQVRGPEDRRQLATADAAGDRGAGDWRRHRRDDRRRRGGSRSAGRWRSPRHRRRAAASHPGSRTAASVGPPGVTTRATPRSSSACAQQVRRVGGQPRRGARRPQLTGARRKCHAGSVDDDLAPAEPIARRTCRRT